MGGPSEAEPCLCCCYTTLYPPPPPTIAAMMTRGGGKSIVQYLHVGEVPGWYSVGVFVFLPGVQMPLHDHPGMVVLSRLLYSKLGVMSYDVVVSQPWDNGGSGSNHNSNHWMDVDCDDAHGNKDVKPPR